MQADLREIRVDDSTQMDGKWRLVWEIVNQGADGRDLRGADLRGANLERAKVTNEQLAQTKILEGATLPDGTVHE